MGILHKLVFLLSKLDSRNAQWRQQQIDRVQNTITEATITEAEKVDELEREIENINEAFERKEKIVWIKLSDSGRFSLCNDEVYLLNSAYFLLPPSDIDAKFLLGILNSSTIRFCLNLVAETSGMGTNRWIKNYVKEFPIPVFAYEQP